MLSSRETHQRCCAGGHTSNVDDRGFGGINIVAYGAHGQVHVFVVMGRGGRPHTELS